MHPVSLTSMDPLTELLNGVRTTGAVFNSASLSGSWGLRFEDGSPLALAAVLSGHAWMSCEGGEPIRLNSGDVAVFSGGAPYVISGDPLTIPDVLVRPGGCTTLDGRELIAPSTLTNPATSTDTLLFNGFYVIERVSPRTLLAALPAMAVIHDGQEACPVSPSALAEVMRSAPGQQVLLDRMLDLMLITALRAWFTRADAQIPSWYRAHGDPVVGPVLRLMHADLSHPWTVEALAEQASVSRAALARRFADLVGQPPMSYLREQRIMLAAELLQESEATIGAIAGRVGFSNAFALSAAFKRQLGISPSQHRAGGPGR